MHPAQMSFLDAAEAVLAQERAPLHPREIAEIAIERGLIRSKGATPAQTIKAKLATDILKRNRQSRFMRTGKNQFGLRAWQDQYQEYVADRFQKALLDEEIVVFSRELLPELIPGPGLHLVDTDMSQDLAASLFPMQRREAEENFDVIQLVSAFLVVVEGRIATYKRTRRLPESRLHGYYSLLFGGHLNEDDVPPLFGIFDPLLGPTYIQRELHEELRFATPPDLELVGVIYDDTREVSRQHLGVLYRVTADPTNLIEVGERGFLQQLQFETPQQILDRIGEFENWSELVLRDYVLAAHE
jgi:predicted NUDIX family phosphoesterase